MKTSTHALCALAFGGATIAFATASRADPSPGQVATIKNAGGETTVPEPGWAFGGAFFAGGGALAETGDVNDELSRAGYSPIPRGYAEVGGRFSAFFQGAELSFAPSWIATPDARDAGLPYLSGRLLMLELGYDALPEQYLTLGPSVGIGWLHSSLCIPGMPNAPSRTEGPLFQQILANPGHESCLDTDSMILRAGGVAGIATSDSMGGPGKAILFANVRPMFEWPIAVSNYKLGGTALPSFAGPTAPHPTFAVFVEVGVAFGAGERR